MKRLFTINGPTQMLNILIQIENSKTSKEKYEDYLAIFHIDSKEKNPYIHEVIEKISTFHKWRKIEFFEGNINAVKTIYSRFNFDKNDVDELYLVRNWVTNNEIFQDAFPQAKVIIYGDSFGIFDSIVSPNYKIEKINLIIPALSIKYSSEKDITNKIQIIPKEKTYKILNQIASLFTNNYNNTVTLFMSSYFSKVYFMTLEQEIDFYFGLIKSNHEKERLIILKPHPRDEGKIINELYNRLLVEGYIAEIIDDTLKAIPIEVLIFILKIDKIVSMISSGLASVKFLKPELKLIYDDLSEVESLKITKEFSDALIMNKELIEKVSADNSKIIYLNSDVGSMGKFSSKYSEVEDLLELCLFNQSNNKEIIAYGAGGRYLKYSDLIAEKGINISRIIDSNSSREGEYFDSKRIISKYTFQQISTKNNKKFFIIIMSSFANDIEWFLYTLGYKKYIDFIKL